MTPPAPLSRAETDRTLEQWAAREKARDEHRPLDRHHERSRRLHPSVWKPQRWLWEAITLGVTLAGLAAFVWFMSIIIALEGGAPALLQALRG